MQNLSFENLYQHKNKFATKKGLKRDFTNEKMQINL